MSTIGHREYSRTFELGVLVWQGEQTETAAVQTLVSELSMNETSAGGYIRAVGWMLKGIDYGMTINRAATEYYLNTIKSKFGSERANLAAQSVRKHLNVNKNPQQSIEKLLSEFEARLDEPLSVGVFENNDAAFEAEVRQLMQLSSLERRAILPPNGTKPEKTLATISVYFRNRAVVAEVRSRAQGVCEKCNKPAPFNKPDGTPFLEVHHKVRLADGGDDTSENAIAVCPNCHRQLHHG